MDWTKLLSEIVDAGMTQVEIASECRCAQSTISDLYRGATTSPGFELGNALVSLHARKVIPRIRPTHRSRRSTDKRKQKTHQ